MQAFCLADTPEWLQRLYFKIKNGDAVSFNRFHNFFHLWVKWSGRVRRIVQMDFFSTLT